MPRGEGWTMQPGSSEGQRTAANGAARRKKKDKREGEGEMKETRRSFKSPKKTNIFPKR